MRHTIVVFSSSLRAFNPYAPDFPWKKSTFVGTMFRKKDYSTVNQKS